MKITDKCRQEEYTVNVIYVTKEGNQ